MEIRHVFHAHRHLGHPLDQLTALPLRALRFCHLASFRFALLGRSAQVIMLVIALHALLELRHLQQAPAAADLAYVMLALNLKPSSAMGSAAA